MRIELLFDCLSLFMQVLFILFLTEHLTSLAVFETICSKGFVPDASTTTIYSLSSFIYVLPDLY